jgi:hypothetical protein
MAIAVIALAYTTPGLAHVVSSTGYVYYTVLGNCTVDIADLGHGAYWGVTVWSLKYGNGQACGVNRTVAAGWMSSQRQWLRWNGSTYISCTSWFVYYSTSSGYLFTRTGDGVDPPCGYSGNYKNNTSAWVWDGSAWRGGALASPAHYQPS